MRNGIFISAVIHVAALWVGFVGVPEWWRSDPEPLEQPVVVELVTVSEETRVARPKPEPMKKDKPPPTPRQRPEPQKPVEAPPAPAEPETEIAAVVPEIIPKPKPPKKVAKPKPPKKVAKPKRKPRPGKVAKAKPETPRDAKSKTYKFDADQIAALVDKTPRERSTPELRVPPKAPPKITSRTAQALEGQPLTMSEVDALRAQIERCWNVQAGARYAEDLVVTIRVFLNPDGSLNGEPQIVGEKRLAGDPYFRAAAESAVRAVLKCQPFKMLPVAKYSRWREIELTFDPGKMLG